MRHKTISGLVKFKNIQNHKVKWDAPCKSKFQKTVKDFFKEFWELDLVYEEMPLVGTRLRLDLANYSKKIAVEVQGAQHLKFNKFFHGNRNGFRRSLERDDKKTAWCEINSYKLVEIFPEDLPNLSKEWVKSEFGIYL